MSLRELAAQIEPKWQAAWETSKAFRAANPGEPGSEKPKFYCLDMFPYPSGSGLHVGHPLGYIATDIICRLRRMQGFNVLHPMGWDAFGLPAEQYAIQTGTHPAVTTKKNIVTFKKQIGALALSYDWEREISTADPTYYKWTQWIFKKLVERGLAYQAEIAVNWCPALGTVLANDEIIDGKSERGGHPVERRPMRQWMLKITDYAERLLRDLDDLDWPESTKEHQRNWIGRSEGAQLRFPLEKGGELEVFTTRPDTLFGVTFMVIAPEHPLVDTLTTPAQNAQVESYKKTAAAKSDLERSALSKTKSGAFTGGYALHPISGAKVPVWVADYVLMNYGTGAIMAVPAHDERDLEFAQAFDLPVVQVIGEDGLMMNSPGFDGTPFEEGKKKVIAKLQEKKLGEAKITYRLRDWIFSRQRYWGEPIPVVGAGKLLRDDELPLTLPEVQRYEPSGSGESPLATVEAWVNTPDGKRETNTMPGSAGSSWYFLRYMDPRNAQAAWGQDAVKYWKEVDIYVGGPEHAVGHLLYSRFWHKVFFDMGLVPTKEPFKKLVHQGMIQGEDGEKMSKSRGNVVNPDDVIRDYGADTFRVYEMFMGPFEKAKPWQTASIEGSYRFVSKYLRLATEQKWGDVPEAQWSKELVQAYHKTIKQVGEDIDGFRFNTAISAMMILLNEFGEHYGEKAAVWPKSFLETFTVLLHPFAPHVTEEIWQRLGHKESLVRHAWPKFDATKTVADEITVGVQVNGKLRDQVRIAISASEAEVKEMVMGLETVQRWMEGKPLKKFVYVKGKIVSVVV